MAEITISVQNTSGGAVPGGARIQAADWPSGFDHAALVTALRSRSDGYDFRFWHVDYGVRPFGTVDGVNTSACRFEFTLPAGMSAGATDTGYRLKFGNLGMQVSPFTAIVGATATFSVTATVPALSLPAPGFPLARTLVYDVDENGYPEFLSARRRARNQNSRTVYEPSWYHLQPEDWYEIRSFVNDRRGGAGSFGRPSWIGTLAGGQTSTCRFLGSPQFRQSSRLGFEASARFEELLT